MTTHTLTAGSLRSLSNRALSVSPVRLILQTPDGPAEVECESFQVVTERGDDGKPSGIPKLFLNLRLTGPATKSETVGG